MFAQGFDGARQDGQARKIQVLLWQIVAEPGSSPSGYNKGGSV
jgi:hypothetical protein